MNKLHRLNLIFFLFWTNNLYICIHIENRIHTAAELQILPIQIRHSKFGVNVKWKCYTYVFTRIGILWTCWKCFEYHKRQTKRFTLLSFRLELNCDTIDDWKFGAKKTHTHKSSICRNSMVCWNWRTIQPIFV